MNASSQQIDIEALHAQASREFAQKLVARGWVRCDFQDGLPVEFVRALRVEEGMRAGHSDQHVMVWIETDGDEDFWMPLTQLSAEWL
jgi:hypothetical protein